MARRRFIPVCDKPFTWVDTETTGLDPDENEIIELAIIRLQPDGTEEIFHTKIQMERPEHAHPRALEVNGYTKEAWAGAPSQQEVWQEVYDRGLFSECIVAGQNVKFDVGMIDASFKRAGIDIRIDYHTYDTCTLALAHLKPFVKSISLVPTCIALGIPVRDAHSALADIRMAMEVDRVLRTASESTRAMWPTVVSQRVAAWEAAGRPNTWLPVSP